MNQRGYLSIVLLIILILIVGFSAFYFKSILKEDPPEFSANQNLQKEVNPYSSSKILYSGNKEYGIVVRYDQSGEESSCAKSLFTKHGEEIINEEVVKFLETIRCVNGYSLELEGFKNFSENDMVFNTLGNELNIFSIDSGKTKKLYYNPGAKQDYHLMAVDTQLKYYLFSKDGYSFIDQVKDYENNEVFDIQPLLSLSQNPQIQSFFDFSNHGILYLIEDSEGDKGYHFKYFDLKTKRIRELKYLQQNQNIVGRGCGGNFIYPETGRLIVVPGCMNIFDKDKNINGEILLNL